MNNWNYLMYKSSKAVSVPGDSRASMTSGGLVAFKNRETRRNVLVAKRKKKKKNPTVVIMQLFENYSKLKHSPTP